ncbi:MAG TPA: nitrogenase component 1 [Methylomusa anaerophila]|uniref:Nitrogenase molybdenum-iron protein beta chain n=1 Tax=Methylomusa anaerophila TaxID=1930071 RepID=A0A348ALT5_9FIRM|nr:nitrogenase component 1 [Methylomusa anaerophila]BBB92033.1 nitrogenase molybdenum-iron protein beta chain [Methylomusa anaerophila]HML87956.1 nitrogenase component 1 [Methylomusa anaerophila]
MAKKTASYRNVNENPCNMCMPMGGILPLKGVEQAMVIIHGSQGCSTYMRRHIAEHFNEPIDVASSSMNEKGTVYGGENNLKKGLDNLIKLYNPKLIGVLTTCLAETIGEDIDRITTDYLLERGLDLPIVTVPTPGYGGTHTEGYFLAVKKIVEKLARPTERHAKINILVPNISPADIREIKRILALMGAEYTLCPDFSDTLDRPYAKPYKKVPDGGTRIEDIAAMPGAPATVEIGVAIDDRSSAGKYLADKFGVSLYQVPIPTGIENTDIFVNTLQKITGRDIPASLVMERGRLLDCMIDSHKYNFQGRSVIFGEPDQVYANTCTCMENGIYPVVVATGSNNEKLAALFDELFEQCPHEVKYLNQTDFAHIRAESARLKANVAIGHSDGRYLTEREGIPLIRAGFPIHDRVGGQRLLSVGYTGTTMFLDRITNTLLENKYRHYRSTMYEKFYQGSDDSNDSNDNVAGLREGRGEENELFCPPKQQ